MDSQFKSPFGDDKTFAQFTKLMTPAPDMLARMWQPMLSASASAIEMNAKWWHAAAEASREWCDFVGRRLEKDAKFMEEMRSAETPQSFMDNVTQFSQTMAKDYQEEFGELSRLSSKAAGGVSEVVREAADSASSSVSSLSGTGARA